MQAASSANRSEEQQEEEYDADDIISMHVGDPRGSKSAAAMSACRESSEKRNPAAGPLHHPYAVALAHRGGVDALLRARRDLLLRTSQHFHREGSPAGEAEAGDTLMAEFLEGEPGIMTHRRRSGPLTPQREAILCGIDTLLGVDKPPDVEFLLVESVSRKSGCCLAPERFNRFAHGALRYRLPSGERYLINVVWPEKHNGADLIELWESPADYIFGCDGRGGTFSRDIFGVRLENVTPARLLALHYYFVSVHFQFFQTPGGFEIGGGYITGTLRSLLRMAEKKTGNCARWIARGLVTAGLIRRATLFPKAIFIELLESNAKNAHVVHYQNMRQAVPRKRHLETIHSLTRPLDISRSVAYWNLKKYADVVVKMKQTNDDGCDKESGVRMRCAIDVQTEFLYHGLEGGGALPLRITLHRGKSRRVRLSCLWTYHGMIFWITMSIIYIFSCSIGHAIDGGTDTLCYPAAIEVRLIVLASLTFLFQFYMY